jgi:hypothetical protein
MDECANCQVNGALHNKICGQLPKIASGQSPTKQIQGDMSELGF